MSKSWSGKGWALSVEDDRISFDRGDERHAFAGADVASLSVARSWFRWRLVARDTVIHRLRGVSKSDAMAIRTEVLRLAVDAVCSWAEHVTATIEHGRREQRWIPREQLESLLATRPSPGLASAVASNRRLAASLDDRQRVALACLGQDLPRAIETVNEATMAAELVTQRDLFDRVERTPLTEEQARAVVCFDNRVQVVAAAGSGKTSLMVARTAYAIKRGFVAPERILLLAFNRDAARELQRRLDERLELLGIDAQVRAATFHSFGLSLIGQATGAKPRLAPWVDSGQDTRQIERIVDHLRDADGTFRYRWDLYRLLFATAPTSADGGDPDGYDKARDLRGFFTFNGEVVRSHGELMIANWLYLNGVEYEYERPYVHSVATAQHSQYRPDFYYPDAEVWHEHWALDRDGLPPKTPEFAEYADSMRWKRELHHERGTQLVESTWAEIVDGDGFAELQQRLEQHGLTFDWNPDRPIPGAEPIKHEDLIRFVRTFLAHVKSNALTRDTLEARLNDEHRRLRGYRTNLFLGIFWEIYDEWQQRLRADNLVDFEDMLVQAAAHLEAGTIDPGYDLVMVDEFQDASNARARVVRGLLQRPGRFLLTVGDDWQSINRFAGADISVMTNFESWFGTGPMLRLETTFRCTQSICDTSSAFVTKNPRQLRKMVRSAASDEYGAPVIIVRTSGNGTAETLAAQLKQIAASAVAGDIAPGPDGVVTVKVLGRYRFDDQLMPETTPDGISVEFLTVHRSKGLEADYVIIPRMSSGKYGFPSGIVDNPLLDLVMAAPDTFGHAEERRLLYVAMTRARHAAILITEQGKESPFVTELIDDHLAVLDGDTDMRPCTGCGQGTMTIRHGKYGYFAGCSRYPACNHTEKLANFS